MKATLLLVLCLMQSSGVSTEIPIQSTLELSNGTDVILTCTVNDAEQSKVSGCHLLPGHTLDEAVNIMVQASANQEKWEEDRYDDLECSVVRYVTAIDRIYNRKPKFSDAQLKHCGEDKRHK